VTFLVYGDTRDGSPTSQALTARMLAEAPDFIVHTGDIVHRGDDEAMWRSFFRDEKSLLERIALYPAAGNHELYEDEGGEHFARYFALPDAGEQQRRYTFRFGPARFVVLDGNAASDPEQAAWLERTLASATEPHLFAVLHQPPLSTGGHCGAGPAEARFVELFSRYKVRAVFGGHDHAYERLERGGVRYFVSGGGGAPLYPERADCPRYDLEARRVYQAAYHFLRVRVSADRVEVAALPLAGPPLEEVTLRASDVVRSTDPPLVAEHRSRFGVAPWLLLMAGGALALGVAGLLTRGGRRRRG
jgi:predicted phosphodiesterase